MPKGKWSIRKRDTSTEWIGWPWLLTYPDGISTCLCFSFDSAVDVVKQSQRGLRVTKNMLDGQLRKCAAGPYRSEALSNA